MARIPLRIPNRLIHRKSWRFLGFFSSLVGLLSYALSPSFHHLFGDWSFLKLIIYTLVSSFIITLFLFAKNWRLSRNFWFKVHLSFFILMLTTFYSFFSDKAMKGKPDLLNLISCAAFAVMSLSLSNQMDLGFEVDLLNFFLGCFTVQLMKIHLMLGFLAAIFCYFFIVLRSNSRLVSQTRATQAGDHVEVDIDTVREADDNTVYQSDYGSDHESQELLQRFDDGYNWKRYEVKQVKGGEKQTSYYKCLIPSCSVKKIVERYIDGQVIEVIYKGTHNHHKPTHTHTMKRNSSFETLSANQPSKAFSVDV